MKRTIAPTTLVIVFVTVFVLGIRPRAQADEQRECSDASLQGSFGFTSIGTLLALPAPFAGPFGEIGRQTFDGQGNTDATATFSANGNIRRVTYSGYVCGESGLHRLHDTLRLSHWCYGNPGLCDRRRRDGASSDHHGECHRKY